jgi:hypothetical protein
MGGRGARKEEETTLEEWTCEAGWKRRQG